ncbi:MAG: putative rane protein [Acidobacteria bacterium]|nr:putative rane protein [Acidobacteriota bacterium]
MAHETHEGLRKSLHIAFGLVAFALAWLPWQLAAAVAGAAVIGNWLLLHRIFGSRVARHERGWDTGIVIYPFAVLVLIVIFRNQLEFAATGWVILAFGDGFATVAGRSMPIAPLPWNHRKSWGGFLAFVVAALIGVFAVSRVFQTALSAPMIAAVIVCAVIESLHLGIDDNITVPLAAATVLLVFGRPPLHGLEVPMIHWGWLALNTALAIAGYAARSVDVAGAVGGWILGAVIILGAGGSLYVTLLAFFILGTLATKLGYARKARLGLAQERGGRRGAAHAFANVGVAAICAVAVWRHSSLLPLFMGIAALATAAADTVASEIGQLIGRRTFLPLTFRRVEPGTEGAISLEGTLAGLLAGFIVAATGISAAVSHLGTAFVGEVNVDKGHAIGTITACALLGSYIESIAGSWNRKRANPVPNGVLNFFNTAVGAVLFAVAAQFVPMFGFLF